MIHVHVEIYVNDTLDASGRYAVGAGAFKLPDVPAKDTDLSDACDKAFVKALDQLRVDHPWAVIPK